MRRNDARRARPFPGAASLAGLRIGLLGGSFNPAHRGHRLISEMFLKRLKLDRVWWLVSPQNPLKPQAGMAPSEERLEGASRLIGGHPRIEVMAIEARLRARYTADTLAHLTRALPLTRFVWLMGADNLAEFDQWRRWRRIFELVPIAVYDRPHHTLKALRSRAAHSFKRLPEAKARRLANEEPPAWVFLHGARSPATATAIRAGLKKTVKELR